MGAVKDIVDLVKDLESRAKDLQDIDTIHKIQSLTLGLQSEHAMIVEKNEHLFTENLDLKRKIHEMERSHAATTTELQNVHRTEIIKITASSGKPKDDLDPGTVEVLKLLFKRAMPMSDTQIAHQSQMDLKTALYHIDCLQKGEFVVVRTRLGPVEYEIDAKGREYVVSNHLNG